MDNMNMLVPEPPISLSGADRLTQRQQIDEILLRAQAKGELLRVRIPFSLYDQSEGRGYTYIRDAVWNLQLPSQQTTVEHVEKLIEAIGHCLVAIANEGSEAVVRKLRSEAAA